MSQTNSFNNYKYKFRYILHISKSVKLENQPNFLKDHNSTLLNAMGLKTNDSHKIGPSFETSRIQENKV